MHGFPLQGATLAEAGLRAEQIERLEQLIELHIAEGRYPGCQIAIARNGRLAVERTFGRARLAEGEAAHADTLWLLFSNTKVITAAALWVLAERGAFRFTDAVSQHVPEFARHGKRDITVLQLITHQGGFPTATVPPAAWADHAMLREAVCNFALEFTPGTQVKYHPGAAHWTAGVLIEALTGQDFRTAVHDLVIGPMGLSDEMFLGLPTSEQLRAADMHSPGDQPLDENNSAAWREAGIPGGGGYATARAMAAFYQMMLAGGTIGGTRILSPRTLAYAIRNWTGDRIDEEMGMPMHRGLGPHLRGTTPGIRGLGCFASPRTFGHGGVGSSYCWADPDSGVSFAYLTNCKVPDPWHSQRMDVVSNLVHSAIL